MTDEQRILCQSARRCGYEDRNIISTSSSLGPSIRNFDTANTQQLAFYREGQIIPRQEWNTNEVPK